MPELGEVAHAAKLLATNLKGKTISKFLPDIKDSIVFPSADFDHLQKSLQNNKIDHVGRHGKYFWITTTVSNNNNNNMVVKTEASKEISDSIRSKYNVLLMHFGMTGWINIKGVDTHFVVMENSKNGQKPEPKKIDKWPPKYSKFELITNDGTEVSFTDPRRLARIRLLQIDHDDDDDDDDQDDVPGYVETQLKKIEPLIRSGPDFSKHQNQIWTEQEFLQKIAKKRVPVKSLLLDQSLFAGVGNWMADEILFQSRIHPEQYVNELSINHKIKLFNSILEICRITVETEGNTDSFPISWLMIHRWSKKIKTGQRPKTTDGYEVDFVTVGGRTSCYVPDLQIKEKISKQESEEREEPAPQKRERSIKSEVRSTRKRAKTTTT
ncbi:Formamidopyrimidine-DNA glycosylase N-terminal domain-containing protein [Lipomyces japonicus]|uniref:Formamidopyrimidine-DNA glycosylase N-terminal domain-containing protein n=1 Tax=Lipomyces japonicus TaxID=56871 RepID=UPI0034CDFA4F